MKVKLNTLTCCNCKHNIFNEWWIMLNRHIYCKDCRDEYQIFLDKKNLVLTKRWQNSKNSYYETYNRWLLDKPLPLLRKLVKNK